MRTISQHEFAAQLSIRHRLDWVREVMRLSNEIAGRLHPIELEPDAAEWADDGRLHFHYNPGCSYAVDYSCTSVIELRGDTVSIYRADGTCAITTTGPTRPLLSVASRATPPARPEYN